MWHYSHVCFLNIFIILVNKEIDKGFFEVVLYEVTLPTVDGRSCLASHKYVANLCLQVASQVQLLNLKVQVLNKSLAVF